MGRFFLTWMMIGALGGIWGTLKLEAQESNVRSESEEELWFQKKDLSFRDYCHSQAKARFLLALDHLKEEGRLTIREVQGLVASYETCSRLEAESAEKYLQASLLRLIEDEKNADFLIKHLMRLWKDTGYLAITKKPIYHDPNGWYRNYEKASLFEKRWMIDTVALETQASFINGYLLQAEVEKLDAQVLFDMQHRVKVESAFSSLSSLVSAKRSPVRLIREDLFDSACELDEKGDNVLVILNGLGLFPWKGALGIQQDLESLLERTTALIALDPSVNKHLAQQLASMNAFALQESLIYLPHVHLLRKSLGSGFAFRPLRRLDFLMTYQDSLDGLEANKDLSEAAWRRQLRSILRAAHQKGHRSLVFGASGLRAQEPSALEIAQAWYDVLGEREFLGQFSQISFVFNLNDDSTFQAFKEKFNPEG